MLISQGVAMLSISAPVLGRMDIVHPVLLWDERDAVLVDTGYPRQLEQLRAAIRACDVDPDRINHIVMTHQDIDHIGNLQQIVEEAATRIEVSADEREKPYIQGDLRLIRFTDEAIASIDRLPPQVPESFKIGLKALMLNPPRAAVDRVLTDGERLPWCGGLINVATPGHTPGHLSLYHEPSRTLIAGDALTVQDGRLCGPDPKTTLDPAAAQASIAKLAAYPIDRVVCYHGGLYADGAIHARLMELASEP